MPTPKIRDETWVYTREMARLYVASESLDIETISFNGWVKRLLDADPYKEWEEVNKSERNYYHTYWEEGTELEATFEEDKLHRPHLADETAQQLDEWVKETHSIDPKEMNYDGKLMLLNDVAERYMAELDVHVDISSGNN